MGVSGLGDTQIYEVVPPAEVAPDGWIVGRGGLARFYKNSQSYLEQPLYVAQ